MKKIKLFTLLALLAILQGCGDSDDLPGVMNTLSVSLSSDMTVGLSEAVTLEARSTYNAAASALSYNWTLVSKPVSSTLDLPSDVVIGNTSTIQFTPDVLGTYEIEVEVTDGDLTDLAVVFIEVIKKPIELPNCFESDTQLEDVYADAGDYDYLVSGYTCIRANVTIAPGVRILFADGAGFDVIENGSLKALGTQSNPITMEGVTKAPGSWKGINFETLSPANELSFVTIAHGGSSGFDGFDRKANITLKRARLKVANCTITESGNIGILSRSQTDDLTGFSSNVITNNKIPVETGMHQYHYLDAATDYTGNENDIIDSHNQDELNKDVTWSALNVPFRLATALLRIAGKVTIEPGTKFLGQPNTGLQITGSGGLIAQGTSSNPIVFEGEQNQVRGYWKGLEFLSNSPENRLEYVEVRNGGEEGFDGQGTKTNISVRGSGRLSIINSLLELSGGSGMALRNNSISIDQFSNNRITNSGIAIECGLEHLRFFDSDSDLTGNDEDFIDSNGSTESTNTTSTSGIWRKTTVPYRFSATTNSIGSDIEVEPGVEMVMAQAAWMRVLSGNFFKLDGTASDHIVIRGEEDVKGYWHGLIYYSLSGSNVFNYVEIANGGGDRMPGPRTNISVWNSASLNIQNSLIRTSAGYGISVQAEGTLVAQDNQFNDNTLGNIYQD